MNTAAPEPVFVAGPTAVGKSEIALALAQSLDGEIVSVDSMQVYRGMDIGTAKPPIPERSVVTHHLIDVAELHESFDAARFRALAQEAVVGIRGRGRVPIFCGGTGLYFQAYVGGLGTAPRADPSLRAQLEATPLPHLLEELERHDPEGFARLDCKNPRRVIRAVEILRLTGQPPSRLRAAWSQNPTPSRSAVLSRDPGDLRRRIDTRVDRMFAQGLVEETRGLLERGLRGNATAMQALGYRQVAEHLDGQRSLDETIQLVKIRTWQFARRQRTWFRRQMRAEWIHLTPDEPVPVTVEKLARLVGG